MWSYLWGFAVGWWVGVWMVILWIRGRMMERWYVTSRNASKGYEILLRRGKKEEMVIYRVKFDRKSSANPDTTFSDQLAQARGEAQIRADALNASERITRVENRKRGTPGGIR